MAFCFKMLSYLRLTMLIPFFALLIWGEGILGRRVLAQEAPQSTSVITAPVELEWLNAREIPGDRPIITSTMISMSGLTPPSLWWTQEQVGGKLLKGWIAYPATESQPAYVDLVVNRQLWNLSDYLERYSFVHHFGQAAQTFGYAVRVFNDVGDYLAVYPCTAQAPSSQSSPQSNSQSSPQANSQSNPQRQTCSVILNSSGLGALQSDDPL